jgi:hypothetical protein
VSEQWFERDPLWFKRAVFYEIHIRGFFDGLHLAAADVPLAAARRRLRHLGLLRDPSGLRDGGRLPRVRRPGPSARNARHRRPRHESHVGRPPVVPGVAIRPDRTTWGLVRLVGHRPALHGRADHLPRHGVVELVVRSPARPVLLAPLLQPSARPELRQSRGAGGDAQRPALLARPRHRRLPPRRGAVPLRAKGRTARTSRRRTRI